MPAKSVFQSTHLVRVRLPQVLTSVSWVGSGKFFTSAYSDGSIAHWSPKVDNKPDKVFQLHGMYIFTNEHVTV